MKLLSAILTLLVSPTRFAIERIKPRVSNYGRTIRTWNRFFRCAALASVVGLSIVKSGEPVRHLSLYTGYVALWLVPFSRINELALAFYQDAFQRFDLSSSKTHINPIQRLKFLLASYFEVAIQFGILFFCFPCGFFKQDFHSIVEAVYFSSVTISTVGYGDITPIKPLSQLSCMYELAVGFILLVFALGSYFTTSLSSQVEQASLLASRNTPDRSA
jgi:hypothetical protein